MAETPRYMVRVAAIDCLVRQIIWQVQKQALHTLNQPNIALTIPQMMTLCAIRQTGTCRMSDLAEITQQSAGTLTGIVDRLIDDGLVGRVRDVDDRRVVQVALTSVGLERLEHAEIAQCSDMTKMLSGFTFEQLGQLEELLHLWLAGIQDFLGSNAFSEQHP